MKKTLFAALLTCVLVSCTPNVTVTPQAIPATETLSPLPTFTPPPFIVLPTSPDLPPITVTSTQSPLPAVLPKFPLDRYVMLFTKDGDLYFQDGENTPVKLTHVGGEHADPHSAILSDDGKKVVFFREGNYRDIYSINADGSNEQLIVKDRPLAEYTGVYSQFIPNTHILLFNTYQCESQGDATMCSTGVSSVDTDTAEIKELAKPDKVGLYTTLSNFSASPDGKMVAVEYTGYIDILDVNGKAIHRNVIPYTPSIPSYYGFPLLPNTFWLPDSSGLIVIVPDGVASVAGFNEPVYSVWRYDIDTAAATQILFMPPLVDTPIATCGVYHVSPDAKWILYYGSEDYTRYPLDGTHSLYIGNLRNGQAQRYDHIYCKGPSWGPDSRHFFYGNMLGSIGEKPVGIRTPEFMVWVDDLHFIFPDEDHEKMLVAEIREDSLVFFDMGVPYFDLVTIEPKR